MIRGAFLRFLATAIAALAAVVPAVAQYDKLDLNTREWEVMLDLQLKHNKISGLEARNQSGSYVMIEGSLKPAAKDPDIKQLRRFGRTWLHEYVRTSFTDRVGQELYVGVLCGTEDGWAKEKNLGDGYRVQNLCAALLERDSFGLYSPKPGKRLKWAKFGSYRGVEFNFEGPWLRKQGSQDELNFFAHGWALDCPGDDLLILFYGPDSREVAYKDSVKVVRKMVGKVKTLTERDLEKYLKEQLELARGKMKKRKWSTPRPTISLSNWPTQEQLEPEVTQALIDGSAWLVKNQVDGYWPISKPKTHNQIGLAGLVGRALLGVNQVTPDPKIEEAVNKTAAWLLDQQDKAGMIGKLAQNSTVYNHAIATAFLLDQYQRQGNPEGEFPNRLQQALDFIQNTQDVSGAWDYAIDDRKSVKCDPSVTYWNVIALARGLECGFKVKEEALVDARNALLSMAGPKGKVGYEKPGGDVARNAQAGKQFPWSKSESLTGAVLYCTLFVDTQLLHAKDPSAFQWHATRRCLERAPSMDPESLDLYYWQAASCGLALMGGAEAKAWREALTKALLAWRISDTNNPYYGTWPTETAWAEEGGRALTTTLAMLSLLNTHALVN